MNDDIFEETCPFCDEVNEYPIIEGIGLLQCKNCGKLIKTCSLCEDQNCDDCFIDKEIKERLKNEQF